MSYEEIITLYIADGDWAAATDELRELGYEPDEIEQILDGVEMHGTEDTWS